MKIKNINPNAPVFRVAEEFLAHLRQSEEQNYWQGGPAFTYFVTSPSLLLKPDEAGPQKTFLQAAFHWQDLRNVQSLHALCAFINTRTTGTHRTLTSMSINLPIDEMEKVIITIKQSANKRETEPRPPTGTGTIRPSDRD